MGGRLFAKEEGQMGGMAVGWVGGRIIGWWRWANGDDGGQDGEDGGLRWRAEGGKP